ncbi:hypothetical protein BD324DRAFT_604856 [Kockovaella imperatae]|uniref:Knr4/Smi1-like domain-containing protein n=1 Tax=Kockovaella imperatae TaxID=4999 RepID=A0A1Y1U997_9TREE|nr:hypothetical protein BD324DRAFT_604856 [Kockovaella imperatae]ORX34601.1 hypothetical protein BD324DRAFT_604856 [Kockovaella imperatae]
MSLFQSISSFFGGGGNNASSSRQARRAAVNSTYDAFSLPRTDGKYREGSLGPSMNDGMSDISSPGPSRRASTAYTYPPRESYQPSSNIYPPLSHTFNRLRRALSDTFPELLETLNGPVDPSLLAAFEQELGYPLPPAVRDTLLIADGQDLDSGCIGLFYGLYLLPLEEVIREWTFWRTAEYDPDAGQNPVLLATMASVPPSWIKGLYACRGWLPLISDRAGNYVGVDLEPGPGGTFGQVIVFGRDFDRKCVLWRGDGTSGWGKWISGFVDELESGDGWEADKSNSSDEEEELGYSNYNGGALAGEIGKGFRLAGEYRGWNVLEAWWDRSVRQWENLGLGMDVEEVERGLLEARRLAGWDQSEQKLSKEGSSGTSNGVEVAVLASPQVDTTPSTPTPADSDILLPPTSPDHPINHRHHGKTPIRMVTPAASTPSHPLQRALHPSDNNLLTPSDARRRRAPPPAPVALDLPTRADVQAMSAIAQAEVGGLRGGWIMNMDTTGSRRYRPSVEEEMVDIDLEGGRSEKFGASKWMREEVNKDRDGAREVSAEDRSKFMPLMTTRTPSPLSRGPSVESPRIDSPSKVDYPDNTPRAAQRDSTGLNLGVQGASQHLQRPPAAVSGTSPSRVKSWQDDGDNVVIRNGGTTMSRSERESSVISTGSNDGLLDGRSVASRSASPAPSEAQSGHRRVYSGDLSDHLNSPATVKAGRSADPDRPPPRPTHHSKRSSMRMSAAKPISSLEEGMEDVSLGEDRQGQVMG